MTKRRISDPPSRPVDLSNHASIRMLLAEYVMILVLEQTVSPEWSALEQHVARCQLCQGDVLILRQHMREMYSGPLPGTPHIPNPDLSFLHTRRSRSTSRTMRGHSLISTARTALERRLQFSAALLPLMQVQMKARGEDAQLRYAYETTLDNDVALTIEIFTETLEAPTCIVRFCVEVIDRNPFDQAGSKVILLASGKEFSNVTGHDGSLSFSDVPIADIENWQIIVTPPAKTS